MTASLAATLITIAYFSFTHGSLSIQQVPFLCGAAIVASWWALKLLHDSTKPLNKMVGPLAHKERERIATELTHFISDYRYPAWQWAGNVVAIGIAGLFYTVAAAFIVMCAMHIYEIFLSISDSKEYEIRMTLTSVVMCIPHLVVITKLIRRRVN